MRSSAAFYPATSKTPIKAIWRMSAKRPGGRCPGFSTDAKERIYVMAKLKDLYPSKWLSVADLKNREVIAMISGITTEEFEDNGKKSTKPVCHFQGVEKTLILNKTNAYTIQEITGHDDTDQWAGVQVCLYPTMVQFGAKMTEAIRIKRPPAAPVIAPPVPTAPAVVPITAPAENQATHVGTTAVPSSEADPVDDIPFGNPLTAG